jgi:hypothetical protein
MERIKVAVSPFYGGKDWTDELTNIKFEKNPRGLSVYSIPAHLDLTNIRRAIRLNSLLLVEGNVGDFNEVEEIVVEAPKVEEPAVEEPIEEVVVEPIGEVGIDPVVETMVEEPKVEAKAAPKKTTRKKTTKSSEK